MKTALIAAGTFVIGLVVGTVWSVLVDMMDPDGEYAANLRRAEHERNLNRQ